MSEQNVEAVRNAWSAYNRGDIDAFLAAASPEVEFIEDPSFPEAGVYRGRDAVRAYIGQFREQFSKHQFEIEELRDLGSRVLALLKEHATGAISGAEVEVRPNFLYDFEDGQVVRVRAYLDRAKALEAAGLQD